MVHSVLFQKPLESNADHHVRATQIQKVRQKQSLGFQPPLNLLTQPKQSKALVKLVWSLSWIASLQTGSLLQTDRQMILVGTKRGHGVLETLSQAKCWTQMLPGSGKTLTQTLTEQGVLGLSLQTRDGSTASLALSCGRAPAQRENLGLQHLFHHLATAAMACSLSQCEGIGCVICCNTELCPFLKRDRPCLKATPATLLLACEYPHRGSQEDKMFAVGAERGPKLLA